MMKSVLLVVLLAVAYAQDDATTTTDTTTTDPATDPATEDAAASVPPVGADMMIMMQVQMEQAMAKKYLDLILRLQHSMYSSQAAMSFVQLMATEYQEDRAEGSRGGYPGMGMYGMFEEQPQAKRHRDSEDDFSFLERGSNTRNLEEDDDTLFVNYDDDFYGADTDEMQAKQDLFGSLQLFYSIKIKLYQTLVFASDLQQEFYFDRMTTYMLSMFGQAAPPQLTQMFYMKTFSTQLKTLKLALTLQTISHFTTWLEDAIDVGTALVADVPNAFLVAQDQDDDLIRDKMFAFSAYNQLAMVNFYIFYIDMYLEYAVMSTMGGAAAGAMPNAASFLEEEATAEPAQSEFMPYMYYTNPYAYNKIYEVYHLIFTMSAAHSGLMSVMLESAAYQKEMDGDEFNDAEADQQRTMAQQLFGAYAQNLMMASQLEYFTSIYELFGMFMQPQAQAQPAAQ